jgi:hypothetical protein
MALPGVDFNEIAKIAHWAIANLGTPAQFTEMVEGTPARTIRAVVYRDNVAQQLLQEADTVPALGLLDGENFRPPNRPPQQFDQIEITADGITLAWTIGADPHPVYAGHRLPIFIVELRRG